MTTAPGTVRPRGITRSLAAALACLVATGALASAGTPRAHAAGPTQDALCSVACTITVQQETVDLGSPVYVSATGAPFIDVTLQFYVVDFDADGAITGLTPSGPPVNSRTNTNGRTDNLTLSTAAVASNPRGGWGFVGLADDTSLDLRDGRRVGAVVGFGADTLRSLGDGYAAQKPVGHELTLTVIGNKPGVGYWVEYRDDSGSWVPAPDQDPSDPTVLDGAPNAESSLSYVVPDTLTRGTSYQFRINSILNQFLAEPVYERWDVIPSDDPTQQARGKNFDPSLAPGVADKPDPTPPPKPTPKPTPKPSAKPSARPTDAPKSESTPAPSTSAPTQAPQQPPSTDDPDAAAPPPQDSPTQDSPTPSASPTPATQPTPDSSDETSGDETSSDDDREGPVWGNEATPDLTTASRPVTRGTSYSFALLGFLLLGAPLVWWIVARRRGARDVREPLQ